MERAGRERVRVYRVGVHLYVYLQVRDNGDRFTSTQTHAPAVMRDGSDDVHVVYYFTTTV